MVAQAIRGDSLLFVFLSTLCPLQALALELPHTISTHLREMVGDLPIRESGFNIRIKAYRAGTDPVPSNRNKYIQVLPEETEVMSGNGGVALQIAVKMHGDLVGYISGHPEPFWFYFKQGKSGGYVQVSSHIYMQCNLNRPHIYIFQVQKNELLVWHRDFNVGTLYCDP